MTFTQEGSNRSSTSNNKRPAAFFSQRAGVSCQRGLRPLSYVLSCTFTSSILTFLLHGPIFSNNTRLCCCRNALEKHKLAGCHQGRSTTKDITAEECGGRPRAQKGMKGILLRVGHPSPTRWPSFQAAQIGCRALAEYYRSSFSPIRSAHRTHAESYST